MIGGRIALINTDAEYKNFIKRTFQDSEPLDYIFLYNNKYNRYTSEGKNDPIVLSPEKDHVNNGEFISILKNNNLLGSSFDPDINIICKSDLLGLSTFGQILNGSLTKNNRILFSTVKIKDLSMLKDFPNLSDVTGKIGNNFCCGFFGMQYLEKISLPESVTTLGTSAFEYDIALSSVTLPQSLTTICERAFANCVSLKEIRIPKKVSKIESQAFFNCQKLESIIIEAKSSIQIAPDAFAKIEDHNIKIKLVPRQYKPFIDKHPDLLKYCVMVNE